MDVIEFEFGRYSAVLLPFVVAHQLTLMTDVLHMLHLASKELPCETHQTTDLSAPDSQYINRHRGPI